MKKKIAIFGSNGFLANNLYKRFGKINKYYLVGSNKKYIYCNYNNINEIKKIINKYKFDTIINCVGYTNIEKVNYEKELCFFLNVTVTNNIVEAIKESNCKPYFIHFSTDHLYNNKGLSSEKDIEIVNYYALSKYYSEQFCNEISSTIIRTNFFGISKHPNKISFSDWVVNTLSKNKKINSFRDIYFNPLSFNSLVKIIDLIISKKITGVYNLGSNNGFSKDKFIKEIIKIKNFNKNLIKTETSNKYFKVNRPKDMRMNITKFEKNYNIKLPKLIHEIKKI